MAMVLFDLQSQTTHKALCIPLEEKTATLDPNDLVKQKVLKKDLTVYLYYEPKSIEK